VETLLQPGVSNAYRSLLFALRDSFQHAIAPASFTPPLDTYGFYFVETRSARGGGGYKHPRRVYLRRRDETGQVVAQHDFGIFDARYTGERSAYGIAVRTAYSQANSMNLSKLGGF
jgi:hypothetical protein